MSIKAINTEAASIVARGVFAKLDCGSGELSAHIGLAFESWQSDHIRNGRDSLARDEFRYNVRKAIESLGFVW